MKGFWPASHLSRATENRFFFFPPRYSHSLSHLFSGKFTLLKRPPGRSILAAKLYLPGTQKPLTSSCLHLCTCCKLKGLRVMALVAAQPNFHLHPGTTPELRTCQRARRTAFPDCLSSESVKIPHHIHLPCILTGCKNLKC